MAKTASIHIRVNEETKREAEKIYSGLGVSIAEAVNMLLHKSVLVQGIPFEIRYPTPNAETIAAIREVEEMEKNPSSGKAYASVAEMMGELLK